MFGRSSLKQKTFGVPKGCMGTFFMQLEESSLDFTMLEIDEDNEELIIEIEYLSNEREEIMKLVEILDEFEDENG